MSVKQALLALLEQGPMYGYQLRAEFESATGSLWPLNVGQVYSTLTRLERDGLVTRHVTPSIPPRVDYELTELGISLREPVQGLGNWAMAHIDCIRAAQERYDARQDAADA